LELCNAAQAMVAGGAAAISARGSQDLAREKLGEADRLTCDRFEGSVGGRGAAGDGMQQRQAAAVAEDSAPARGAARLGTKSTGNSSGVGGRG
jgi:hypothetical protein